MIINIDKPIGWTSFDVVKKVKNITKHKKVGHGGTLDPFASGVLVLGTEKDTKKLSSIQEYKFREIINKHVAYNRKGLAMANEAKLRKINEKLEIKEAKLNNDKNFTANSYDVSIVIVDII